MRDIIFIPDASSVAAKMTKTHARGPVTGCMSGELFEVKGISVPALEVKDKLAPLETEYMLSRVGMFGRPGQPVWLDYVKTLNKRVADHEVPQLFFVSPSDFPEEGIYHLPLTPDLRRLYFGDAWEARSAADMRNSAILEPARRLNMLSAGVTLEDLFGCQTATTCASLLIESAIAKIGSAIYEEYDRVGGLNQKVHAEALMKYTAACDRVLSLISAVTKLSIPAVKKLSEGAVIVQTPKLVKRAEQRSQA